MDLRHQLHANLTGTPIPSGLQDTSTYAQHIHINKKPPSKGTMKWMPWLQWQRAYHYRVSHLKTCQNYM